jgi:hypothetical protein
MTAPFLTPRTIPKIGLALIAITMTSMTQCQIENDPIIAHLRPRASFARFVLPLLRRLTWRKSSLLFGIYNADLPTPESSARRMGGATALARRAKAEAIPIMLGTTAMGFAECSTHPTSCRDQRLRKADYRDQIASSPIVPRSSRPTIRRGNWGQAWHFQKRI